MRLRIQGCAFWSCGSGRWCFVRDSLGGALSQPHRFSGKIVSGCSMLLGPSVAATALALMQPGSVARCRGLRTRQWRSLSTPACRQRYWLRASGHNHVCPHYYLRAAALEPAQAGSRERCRCLRAANTRRARACMQTAEMVTKLLAHTCIIRHSWRQRAGASADGDHRAVQGPAHGKQDTHQGLRAIRRENDYNCSSQLRADQMPGPRREGQLMCTVFLSMRR